MKAIMFSGQGSQKIGMGKEFYDNFAECRVIFDEASQAVGFDVAKLCFEEKELLTQTQYAQPALLTVGVAIYRFMAERGFCADVLMGLSLGEYTALAAAEAFDFADAVRLVHKRGKLMAEFAKEGGMLASIGVDKDMLEEICKQASGIGYVACANYNTYEQIVLAGERAALDACAIEIKKAGGKAMPLKVSGPFHTPLMADAAEKFAHELAGLAVKTPALPVISNVDAELFPAGQHVDVLTRHMTSPVLWTKCVEKAVAMGVNMFIEVGMGKTLVNFVKSINGSVAAFALESMNGLEEIL